MPPGLRADELPALKQIGLFHMNLKGTFPSSIPQRKQVSWNLIGIHI